MVETIQWTDAGVVMIDQTRLPREQVFVTCRDYREVAQAIRSMVIRGAPAIGVAAAMGIALGVQEGADFETVCRTLAATRPTAVNLFWAVDRMRRVMERAEDASVEKTQKRLIEEALHILEEDIEINRKIGENGKSLIRNGYGVLTHCNAGALATAGYGTALGVMRAAWAEGKRFHVFVDETRPVCQGARLTAWELSQERIPYTILTDNMAGWLMKQGKINLVLVGADRIARNGDTANKIGTYSLSVLAKWHGLPFYIAAPISTLDLSLSSGSQIPIEERGSEEVTHFGGRRITPEGAKAFNPAFDVTPHSMIRGIITEKKIVRTPFEKNLKRLKNG